MLLNAGVALAVARRYHGRGIDSEDLDQTAYLCLVQAARTFDRTRGSDFLCFAVPTIVGGVKQHFRDLGWTIRVPRRVQEVQLLIDREGLPEADEARYGVAHRDRLAQHLQVTAAEVEAALRARGCFSPASLDRRVGRRRGRSVPGSSAVLDDAGRRRAPRAAGPVLVASSRRGTGSCCGCASTRTGPSSRSRKDSTSPRPRSPGC